MNRPKVIINGAMSIDGKTALPSGKQLRLSSKEDIARVYRLRHQYDAVLVGIGTVLSDDPKLTVKKKYVPNPNQPLRVILDGDCRTPEHALVVNDAAETCIFTKDSCKFSYDVSHIQIYQIPEDDNGLLSLPYALEILYQKGIRNLLVEGGGTVIWSFISQGLFDELSVYIAPVIIGGKNTPTLIAGKRLIDKKPLFLDLVDVKQMGEGILLRYTPVLNDK